MVWRGNQGPVAPWNVRWLRAIAGVLCATALAACAQGHIPGNNALSLFDPEKSVKTERAALVGHNPRTFDTHQCAPPGTTHYMATAMKPRSRETVAAMTMRYSSGDRFNIQVPGSVEFNGDYVINADGRVILPLAGELKAVGLTNTELNLAIERAFVKAKLFQPDGFKIAVRPIMYSAINVSVSGAVFLPGRYTIGSREGPTADKALGKYGDSPPDRNVGNVFRAGGGVRPDADLSRIKLIRDGKIILLDWQGAVLGAPVDDVPLLNGDHIDVPETGCFQSALMRPSTISPPGIRLFLSNLTQPANNNAGSAVSRDSFGVPYGTRFLQGLVSANCVGGSLATNARRYGVLISRNPKTHRTEVIQRSVEELVISPDRDEINPYLMPDDAIACYDSAVTDIREISTTINQLLLPRATLRGN
jgi:polysaccharide biosynthesis/export protein